MEFVEPGDLAPDLSRPGILLQVFDQVAVSLFSMFRKIAFHLARKWRRQLAVGKGSAAYWNASMVATRPFDSKEDSLEHFYWRNAQYPGYIDLLPVSGQDEKVVVDYGCGPGNDLVGFSVFSIFE